MNAEQFSEEAYFESHLPFDPRRDAVWKEIAYYLKDYIPSYGRTLEIGAGYCHFINHVVSRERYATDISPIVSKYAAPGVTATVASCDALLFPPESLDTVLASNLFEHLTNAQFETTVRAIYTMLKPGGRLIIIQPNFRYAYRDYFDDYTHIRIFTNVSLKNQLRTFGFTPEMEKPKFVPYSMSKTSLPIPSWIIRMYLRSPWKPKAGQMLLLLKKLP